MFKFSQLNQIHLEITNNCQAACPMCSRNQHGGLENPLLQLTEWSLEDYKSIVTPEVLEQIDTIYFCGNFGEPIVNNNLIDMCRHTRDISPGTIIRIHTNGGARSKEWWRELASVLPEKHCVIFAIDGLSGTHELYRIGTTFEKVIENAKAFIDAGGVAEWAYIRFKHNEHQVEEARALAKQIGFNTFQVKDSSRFLVEPKFPVYNKQGELTHNLEPSGYSEIKFISKDTLKNYREVVKTVDINCYAIVTSEVYIDAFKNLFPCCYIGMIPYVPVDTFPDATAARKAVVEEYHEVINDLGGIEALHTLNKSVKDIIDSEPYQTVWQRYWDEKKLLTCARACGVTKEFSNPQEQFITNSPLQSK